MVLFLALDNIDALNSSKAIKEDNCSL